MSDQNRGYARIRHTATGALAALALVARSPRRRPGRKTARERTRHAAVAGRGDKDADVPGAGQDRGTKAGRQPPAVLERHPTARHRRTITATEGQAVDREIRPQVRHRHPHLQRVHPVQLQAVNRHSNTKRALCPQRAVDRVSDSDSAPLV